MWAGVGVTGWTGLRTGFSAEPERTIDPLDTLEMLEEPDKLPNALLCLLPLFERVLFIDARGRSEEAGESEDVDRDGNREKRRTLSYFVLPESDCFELEGLKGLGSGEVGLKGDCKSAVVGEELMRGCPRLCIESDSLMSISLLVRRFPMKGNRKLMGEKEGDCGIDDVTEGAGLTPRLKSADGLAETSMSWARKLQGMGACPAQEAWQSRPHSSHKTACFLTFSLHMRHWSGLLKLDLTNAWGFAGSTVSSGCSMVVLSAKCTCSAVSSSSELCNTS